LAACPINGEIRLSGLNHWKNGSIADRSGGSPAGRVGVARRGALAPAECSSSPADSGAVSVVSTRRLASFGERL
jgi:hypothetical protein